MKMLMKNNLPVNVDTDTADTDSINELLSVEHLSNSFAWNFEAKKKVVAWSFPREQTFHQKLVTIAYRKRTNVIRNWWWSPIIGSK